MTISDVSYVGLVILIAVKLHVLALGVSLVPVKPKHHIYFAVRSLLESVGVAALLAWIDSAAVNFTFFLLLVLLVRGVNRYLAVNHVLPRIAALFLMSGEAARSATAILDTGRGLKGRTKTFFVRLGPVDLLGGVLALSVEAFHEEAALHSVISIPTLVVTTVGWLLLVCGAFLATERNSIQKMLNRAHSARLVNLIGYIPWMFVDSMRGQARFSLDRSSMRLLTGCSNGAPRSVIAIQLESVDMAAFNAISSGLYVMPYLREIAAAHHLSSCRSIQGIGGTSDVELAVINGFNPPPEMPVMLDESFGFESSILKAGLMKNGYHSFALHNNISTFYKRHRAYRKMGFDAFYGRKEMGLKEYRWGARDQDVLQFADKKLNETVGPLFAYIITMSTHAPHNFVESYGVDLPSYTGESDDLVRSYFRSLNYLDSVLRDFLPRWLSRANTSIVIFGDHGAGISRGGFTSSRFGDGAEPGCLVPLIVCNSPWKLSAFCSTTDIGPTILQLANVNFEVVSCGRSILLEK